MNTNTNAKFTSISVPDIESQTVGDTLDSETGAHIIKTCCALIILIFGTPIIVSDLYFGFVDSSCVNERQHGLDISIKTYLLVSGFVRMVVMLLFVAGICSISHVDQTQNFKMFYCVYYVGLFAYAFEVIWNILGAIVFWETIYGENICDTNMSTYMFVSLIIKLIFHLISAIISFNNKKN